MSTRTTTRALRWLIGLLLLVCGNLQAEVRLTFSKTDSKSFSEPNPAIDPTPISLTATAGVLFNYEIPVLLLENNAIYTSPQLPGNGLRLSYDHYPPSIVGAPNATGVLNLTINAHSSVNNQDEFAWVPITITVNPPTPISLTATAGVPLNYKIPVLLPENNAIYTSPQLPGNGLRLSYDTYPPSIVGAPNVTGVLNLTINAHSSVNNQDEFAWVPITITVNPPTPISLTATVGVTFQQTLPYVIPTEGLVSISVTGLPANGLHFEPVNGPGIQGVPLTSGVMNLTLLVNNGFPGMSWRPISLTVNPDPNHPIDPDPVPISLTATVGVAFQQMLPYVIPTEGLVSISVTGLPANGLHFEPVNGPSIQGVPLTSGVMNLTLLVNNGFPGMSWRPISLTVNPAPNHPIDPDPVPINLTATVGVAFQQTLPYVIPTEGLVSISVTGLPANGLHFEPVNGPSIQGVPLTSGVMNLTLLVNNGFPGMSWRPISLTVNPSATSFAITGVNQISCQTLSASERQLTFTPQYVGTTGQPIIFTVYQQLSLTTQPGPYSLNLNTSNPLITLIAQQNGVLSSYNYQWLAACSTTTPNRPPTTTGIPTQTAQPGQAYQLSLANYFFDPDGNPLTYIVSGLPSTLNLTGVIISGTPSSTGSFPISVTAVDPSGLFVSTSFQLTVNGTTPPTQPFKLVSVTTNGCQSLGGNQWQVTFTPQYTGLTGDQIVLAMTNGIITTQAGPYNQTLSADQPLLTLIAQQGNTTSSYNYFWLAACTGGARQAASEVGNGLQVKVFGNPVQSQQVEVEISGVIGRWVEVTVMDIQGRSHYQQRLDWSTDRDRINLPVGQGVGTHLIQVRTERQVQTVKLIKSR